MQAETSEFNTGQTPLKFWLRWVLATTVGGVTGSILGIVSLLFLARSLFSNDHSELSAVAAFFFILPWFTALLVGLAIGLAQWIVLKSHLTRTGSGLPWVLLTGGSALVAVIPVGAIVYSIAAVGTIPFALISISPVAPATALSLPALAATVAGGATIGLAQWIVLQSRLPRAHWWILANSVGWLLGVVLGGFAAGLSNNWLLASYGSLGYGEPLNVLIVSTVNSLIIGAITGVLLIGLSQPNSGAVVRWGMLGFSAAAFLVVIGAVFYANYIEINPQDQLNRFTMDAKVRSAALSADNKYIAAGDENYSIEVWRIADGQSIFSISGTEFVRSEQEDRQHGYTMVAWSPDGKYLATTSSMKAQAIRVWETVSWQPVFTDTIADNIYINTGPDHVFANTSVPDITWSPDGKRLAAVVATVQTCCDDSKVNRSDIRIYDMPGGVLASTLVYSVPVLALAWSPDSSDLALGVFDIVNTAEDKSLNKVISWDIEKGGGQATVTNTSTLVEQPVKPLALDWSPDGTRIAIAVYGEDEHVWDVTKHEYISLPQAHDRTTNDVSWSPDGTLLASTSDDLTATIFDVTGNKILATLGHTCFVTSIDWSPDGTLLATGSDDGSIRLWHSPR